MKMIHGNDNTQARFTDFRRISFSLSKMEQKEKPSKQTTKSINEKRHNQRQMVERQQQRQLRRSEYVMYGLIEDAGFVGDVQIHAMLLQPIHLSVIAINFNLISFLFSFCSVGFFIFFSFDRYGFFSIVLSATLLDTNADGVFFSFARRILNRKNHIHLSVRLSRRKQRQLRYI